MYPRTIGLLLMAGYLFSAGTGCSEQGGAPGPEAPAVADAGAATLTEVARIDGHAEALVPIQGVLLAEDGSVVVGQPQNFEVRWFDENGEPVGRFGSQGEGPGEFRGIQTMGWRADTLWVFDPTQQRTSFVSPNGGFVRTEAMPRELRAVDPIDEPPSRARAIPVAIGADDFRYVTFGFPVGEGQPSPFGDAWVIGRMSSQGILDRFVAQAPRGQVSCHNVHGSGPGPVPTPRVHRCLTRS